MRESDSVSMSRKFHPEISCKECGRMFTPTHGRQVFCSSKCRNRLQMRKYTRRRRGTPQYRICQICGERFSIDSHRIKFCSEECRARAPRNQWQRMTPAERSAVAQMNYVTLCERLESDSTAYARFREKGRLASKRHWDKRRKRPYIAKLSIRIPDTFTKGQICMDEASPFIWNNQDSNQLKSNLIFKFNHGQETKRN